MKSVKPNIGPKTKEGSRKNDLELMKFRSTNPQECQCFFQSMDVMGVYSSMDGAKWKFRGEGVDKRKTGEKVEREKKLKKEEFYSKSVQSLTRFCPPLKFGLLISKPSKVIQYSLITLIISLFTESGHLICIILNFGEKVMLKTLN